MENKRSELFYFNPGHENAILNGSPYYMAPNSVVKMQQDLQILPIWYALDKDCVFIENEVDHKFIDSLNEHFKSLPKLVEKKGFDNKSMYNVHLWGISPQAIHIFEKIQESTLSKLKLPVWNDKIKELTNRKTATDCLSYMIQNIPELSENIIPLFFDNLKDIESFVTNSKDLLLCKAPFSSSGRGLLWLPLGGLTQTERQIIHGHLKKQSIVSIEKVLNKTLDFAMEFNIQESSIDFIGYSLFNTNNKGSYTGNVLASQKFIENKLCEYISLDLIESAKIQLIKYMREYIVPYYNGCVGIDMLIYKDKNQKILLHPCLEINLRDNMGLVALKLSKNILSKDVIGNFNIDFHIKEDDLLEDHLKMLNLYPLSFDEFGKIKSGYMSLCPINSSTKYRAYILINA